MAGGEHSGISRDEAPVGGTRREMKRKKVERPTFWTESCLFKQELACMQPCQMFRLDIFDRILPQMAKSSDNRM